MKKLTKFLSVFAFVAMSITMVSCSDNETPNNNSREQKGNQYEQDDYSNAVIYIDECGDACCNVDGNAGMIRFREYPLIGYKMVYTHRTFEDSTLEIYLPAHEVNFKLRAVNDYWWLKTEDFIIDESSEIPFQEVVLGEYPKNYVNSSENERYFYRKTNDYLTVTHESLRELNFNVSANDSSKRRKMSILVSDEGTPTIYHLIRIIFIQEGKK